MFESDVNSSRKLSGQIEKKGRRRLPVWQQCPINETIIHVPCHDSAINRFYTLRKEYKLVDIENINLNAILL